ncbi:MAG: SDR family NAD(P)-dependent oxidoreductase [Mycobacteriales bacterium]
MGSNAASATAAVTSGLGYVTVRELARHGANVVLTARNDAKGNTVLARLRNEFPDAMLQLRRLDLSGLTSVREFAVGIA